MQVNGALATMSGSSAVLIWALRYYNLRQNLTWPTDSDGRARSLKSPVSAGERTSHGHGRPPAHPSARRRGG